MRDSGTQQNERQKNDDKMSSHLIHRRSTKGDVGCGSIRDFNTESG